MSIVGIFIIIVSVCGIMVAIALKDENGKAPYSKLAWVGLIGILVGFAFTCIATVPRGTVGVAVQFRAVTGDYREQGLQFKSPFVKLQDMNIQTQIYEVKAIAASKDLQDVNTSIALNYHLEKSYAPTMYRDLGEDYIDKLAAPAVQETVKKITAKYLAEDLILKRDVVKADITNDLSDRLMQRGIITEAVSITNFQFSDVFSQAIEAKVSAQQAVFEAQNKLERVKVEAQQREAQALGEANARIRQAEGEAEYIRIVTDAQVKANDEINASLNDNVLRYILYKEAGSNTKLIVIPQGQPIVLPDMNTIE